MGAGFGEYDGWRLPKDFGDPAAERAALESGCAAFDLSSFGRITLKGGGAEEIVGALVVALPAEERWCWSAAISESAPLRIGRVRGGYLILTPPALRQDVLNRIQTLADSTPSEVSIADMTEKTGMLGIYGPQSLAAVKKILPFDLSGIEPQGISVMSFFMITITILRGAWTGGDGVELICPASAAAMAAGAVAKYQQRENIVPAGMDCLLAALRRT
jgi:glycine cleavage system aminomethyltransferase T